MDGFNPPPSLPKRSLWVLRSTPGTIAAGQISLFALIEIPVATIVFGWLALHNPWPWTSLLGLLAAPILLLRSDPAVEMGLEMLRRWWAHLDDDSPHWPTVLADGVAAGLATFLLMLSLGDHLPVSLHWAWGLGLAWGIGSLGGSVGFAGRARGVNGYFAGVPGGLIGGAAGLWLCGGGPSPWIMLLGLLPLIVFFIAAVCDWNTFAVANLGSGLILGCLWRAIFIRLLASLRHLRSGLAAFSGNWANTVLILDPAHLPELLPRAGEIAVDFSLPHLLRVRAKSEWPLKVLLIFIIYLPALLYRWNIKASWWLWGPVALMLRPAAWEGKEGRERDEAMRRSTAFWSTWALQGLLFPSFVALVGWLAWPWLPLDVQKALPAAFGLVQKHLATPSLGLRFGLAALSVGALVAMLFHAYRVRSAHAKALEGGGDFHKGYDEDLKRELHRMARPLRRWQQVTAALMVFTVWSFALDVAMRLWPDQTRHAVWQWLRPWL